MRRAILALLCLACSCHRKSWPGPTGVLHGGPSTVTGTLRLIPEANVKGNTNPWSSLARLLLAFHPLLVGDPTLFRSRPVPGGPTTVRDHQSEVHPRQHGTMDLENILGSSTNVLMPGVPDHSPGTTPLVLSMNPKTRKQEDLPSHPRNPSSPGFPKQDMSSGSTMLLWLLFGFIALGAVSMTGRFQSNRAQLLPFRYNMAKMNGSQEGGSLAQLSSLLTVSEMYDAFLLDQFGVIHDGKRAYDGAVDAVRTLQNKGKKIVIISNSSRRKTDTIARLRSMGFGPFEGDEGISETVPCIDVVTSGDLVFDGLHNSIDPSCSLFDGLGVRCFVFGNGADDEVYVRDAGRVASPIEQADFILARGLFSLIVGGPSMLFAPEVPYTAEAEEEILREALRRRPGGLPLLVANPDEVRPDGMDSPMPGQLARRYREMGGTDIRFVGKPHTLIYDRCRQKLDAATAAGQLGSTDSTAAKGIRIAAVGDSLSHDVLGAAQNGFDSVLCCNGVHSVTLGVPQGDALLPSVDRLHALLRDFAENNDGCQPTHVLAAFRL